MFFHLCLVSVLSGPSLSAMKLQRNLSLVSVFFFRGLLNHLQLEDEHVYFAADEHFRRRGRMRSVLVMKALMLEAKA